MQLTYKRPPLTPIPPRKVPRNKVSSKQREPLPEPGPTPETLKQASRRTGITYGIDKKTRKPALFGNTQTHADPITKLHTTQKITSAQHRAAREYMRLRTIFFGPATPASPSYNRMAKDDVTTRDDKVHRSEPIDLAEARDRAEQELRWWGDYCAIEKALPPHERSIVQRVLIDEREIETPRQLVWLKMGLEAILKVVRERRRAAIEEDYGL